MFNRKKIISFFLAVAMVFSVMSIPAFAEDTYTWEIDEDGVLIISGTAELPFKTARLSALALCLLTIR